MDIDEDEALAGFISITNADQDHARNILEVREPGGFCREKCRGLVHRGVRLPSTASMGSPLRDAADAARGSSRMGVGACPLARVAAPPPAVSASDSPHGPPTWLLEDSF